MTKQKDASEWERPVHAKLTEVTLASGDTTLVAGKPHETDMPATSKIAEELHLAVLDRELGDFLKDNHTRSFNKTEMIDAMTQKTSLPKQKLKTMYMDAILGMEGTHANRCFDATRSQKAGQWTWVDPE